MGHSSAARNGDQDVFSEQNFGDTGRLKRPRLDVTDTCDPSDKISVIESMKTLLGPTTVLSVNNTNSLTQASLLPHPSNSEDCNKVVAMNDTDLQHVAVNLKFITNPSVKRETVDRICNDAINDAPIYIKEQTSDHQEQCEVVADQKPQTCETGSCETSENPITESFQSETLTVSGTITRFEESISSKASKEAQNEPHILITAKRSAYDKLVKKESAFSLPGTNMPWSSIKKEFDTLANYMDPIPVIDLWTKEDPSRAFLIRNSSDTIQISRTLLEFVQTNGLSAYSKFKQCLVQTGQRALAHLLELEEENKDTSSLKWMLEHKHDQKPSGASLFEDFKEDLITYYRDNDSNISISPLVDEHDVPLVDFYVRPPITVFMKPHILSKSTERREHSKTNDEAHLNKNKGYVHQNKEIASYKELFFQEDGSPFTKIYLTAPAGMGKSSLSQHITMCWCQSHNPVEQSANKYQINDLKAMREFDVLFLLHLREWEGSGQCNLDDLVKGMCSNLSRRSRYTEVFLETVLHEKRCLIVLDGLDEWSHPSSCRKKQCVPHNNHPNNCTVLTTTRHWKLATVGLSSAHIDRRAEICELDILTSCELEANAITILNERVPRQTHVSFCDFQQTILSIYDNEIINTPYIKLLLITLWYDGTPLSNSKCEIYSNIIELILTRGLKKLDLPSIKTSQPDDKIELPKCMKNNALFKMYFNLISKIGQIAFFSLFNEKKELRLLFYKEMVLKYLSDFELDFCLKTGLLCQTKDSSLLTKICYKIFFQHKSIQEYFVGFYISTEWRNDITRATILKVCQSLSEILEMSDVLIFVCGMNPVVFKEFSNELQKVVERDPILCSYRSSTNNPKLWELDENLKSYQRMQVACFKETVNYGNDDCKIPICDLILPGYQDYDSYALKKMISSYPQNLKSLKIEYFDTNNDYMMLLKKDLLNVLPNQNEFTLFRILTDSVNSLTLISLQGMIMPCKVLCTLFNHIADMKMLQAIYMDRIRCSDSPNDEDSECDFSPCFKLYYHGMLHQNCPKEILHSKLDLSQNSQLKQLHLEYIPVSQLIIPYTSKLQQLHLVGIPIRHLDLFQNSHLNLIHFTNILLNELDLSVANQLQNLHLAYLSLHRLDLSHTKYIKQMHLEFIPLSKLDLTHTSQLQQLHLENIPLSELDLSQTNLLKELYLKNIPLSQLDLCQTSQLQQLHLKNKPYDESILPLTTQSTPYNESHFNAEYLIKCISSLTYSLPHNSLYRLFESIHDAKDIQIVVLKNIVCSDHNEMCIGNSLILREHIQLQKLQLHNIPLSELVISQTNQLEALDLQNISTGFLDISSDSQLMERNAKCLIFLSVESCVFTHMNIDGLFKSIQKANNLITLTLQNIHCSDHNDMCIGIPLTLSPLSKLWKLHLQEIRLMELHLPKRYFEVTLDRIAISTLAFKTMLLSTGKWATNSKIMLKQETVSASTLKEVFLSTDILQQNVSVKLNGIAISTKAWGDVFRTITGLSKPLTLTLSNITMADFAWTDLFRIITDLKQPVSLGLSHITMSDSAWTDVFLTISSLTQPIALKLKNITMSDSAWTDVFRTIRIWTQSISLELTNIQMSDSAWTDVIQTFSSFTKPVALKLKNITMLHTTWKELFLSIGNLSQPLELSKITMSATAWQELLVDTVARVPKPVTVELSRCMGPSREEWEYIENKITQSPAFYVLRYSVH